MDALLHAALAGTTRGDGAAVAPGTPAETLAAGLPDVAPERRLLLMAGARAVYRRAGRTTRPATATLGPAPADEVPACPPGAARLIAGMFVGQQADLLPEACAVLQRAGLRLPPELLPAALDAGQRSSALRGALAPVLGARGAWLARFNRDWRWLDGVMRPFDFAGDEPADAATAWEEGTPGQRLAALRRVRAEDPARGREWLVDVWKAEKADFRAEAVGALETGLSPADEHFLDAALDDRSSVVRSAAAGLLARLPGTALARRMAERADAMLAYTPPEKRGLLGSLLGTRGGGASGRLHVTPPESVDKDWQRDGIQEKPPGLMGQRAWWLVQVLSLVPPAHWTERFDVSPEDLIAAAMQVEWGPAVLEGWSRAAIAERDPAWAEALWDAWERRVTLDARALAVAPDLSAGLLRCLTPETAGRLAARLLADPDTATDARWRDVLAVLPVPWSAEFGHRYLAVTRERLTKRRGQDRDLWTWTIPTAAHALPPACFAAALQEWPSPEAAGWSLHEWRRALDSFTETIQTRQRLHYLIEEITR